MFTLYLVICVTALKLLFLQALVYLIEIIINIITHLGIFLSFADFLSLSIEPGIPPLCSYIYIKGENLSCVVRLEFLNLNPSVVLERCCVFVLRLQFSVSVSPVIHLCSHRFVLDYSCSVSGYKIIIFYRYFIILK